MSPRWHRRGVVVASIVMILAFTLGCAPGGPSLVREGYRGVVFAHVPRMALSLDDELGSKLGVGRPVLSKAESGTTCRYFTKVTSRGPDINVSECYGEVRRSDTGWGYWISANTIGFDERARQTVDDLTKTAETVTRARFAGAKVEARVTSYVVP